MAAQPSPETTYYDVLGVKPTASPQQIRRAYRDRSKDYHPDTTALPAAVATEKFQVLNEAYATLSSPERRLAYDHRIGYSRVAVLQAPAYLNQPASERRRWERSNAYLDPSDRPLSPGELFALFILGVTFVGCLLLVVVMGFGPDQSLPWMEEATPEIAPVSLGESGFERPPTLADGRPESAPAIAPPVPPPPAAPSPLPPPP